MLLNILTGLSYFLAAMVGGMLVAVYIVRDMRNLDIVQSNKAFGLQREIIQQQKLVVSEKNEKLKANARANYYKKRCREMRVKLNTHAHSPERIKTYVSSQLQEIDLDG